MDYTITIRRDPSVGGANTEGVSPPPATRGVATQKSASVVQSQTGALARAAATKVATQTAQSMAQVYMANRTTEINVLAGSNQYAQRQAAINSIATSGINMVSGAITTGAGLAALGVAAGPAGWIGLAVSALSELISGVTDYVQKKDEIQTKYTAESQELDYLRSRGGPFYNGSR
jgi:hypothetical protein